MKKAVKLLLILFLALSLNGCDTWDDWFGDDDDDDDDVVTTTTTTTTDTAAAKTTTASSDTASTTAASTTTSSGTVYATYFGKTNGGLPTWYFGGNMSDYPTTFTLTIDGCGSSSVSNNGHRWTGLGCVLKQSEVSGRGMGLICTACGPAKAYINW